MATAVCNLGHTHMVCDRCGGSGIEPEDDGAAPVQPLSRVQLIITSGGQLGEALVCEPCMYILCDAFRHALVSGREGME